MKLLVLNEFGYWIRMEFQIQAKITKVYLKSIKFFVGLMWDNLFNSSSQSDVHDKEICFRSHPDHLKKP